MPMQYDDIIWAKSSPFCPLSQHMIAVGACAEVYLSAISSTAILRRLAEWLELPELDVIHGLGYAFALHDIGKAHPCFQYRQSETFTALHSMGYEDSRSSGDPRFRHEAYGAEVLKRIWGREKNRFPGLAGDIFAAVIRLHHQGKAPDNDNHTTSNMWKGFQQDLEQRMWTLFCPEVKGIPKVQNADALGMLLTALLILCDWVASSSTFGICQIADDHLCLEWAKGRAKDTLTQFGLICDIETAFPMEDNFCAFWPTISRDGMRPLQRVCEEIGNKPAALTIIEAPPGEGKTEAALYLAGRLCAQRGLHGIYMALPTAATSNQMVNRVSDMLGCHGIDKARLLHGSAWMIDDTSKAPEEMALDEDAKQAADWLRPLRRGMLSENAVGTVDQAMSSVLKIKYGMLRLAGLSEKVLIIDEIHAYDAYMSRIIARLLDWCKALRIPVILLSATLQQSQKDRYIACFTNSKQSQQATAYPLITRVSDAGNVTYHSVDGSFIHTEFHFSACRKLGDISAIAELAQKKTANGGCLCVMTNTVARAQAIYEELKQHGDSSIMLFHARFRMQRRAEIERECLRLFGKGEHRPQRMILVCTQVVEQSLDVDFDSMITELAPVDLLIQRAGRVHRHAEVSRPDGLKEREITVLVPEADATDDLERRYGPFGYVYAPCVLRSTEKWLGEARTVRMPEDVRESVEQVYANMQDEIEAFVQKLAEDASAEVAADGCIYGPPNSERFFGRVPSNVQSINMEDSDDLNDILRRGGAKTRDGQDSICVAFLPSGFQYPEGNDREQAKEIMKYSIGIPIGVLTENGNCDILKHTNRKDIRIKKFLKNMILCKPEEDGSYCIGKRQFLVDDMIGFRKGE